MRNVTVTFDDGTTHVYQNVPDGVTPEQVTKRAQSEFGKSITKLDGGRHGVQQLDAEISRPDFASALQTANEAKSYGAMTNTPQPKPDFSGARNFGMGMLKGTTDIGSTLLAPVDMTGITGMTPQERRSSIGQFFNENANPQSIPFQAGALTSQVAGTAGVGGTLAKGAQALKAAPKLVSALQSGGFRLGTPAATTAGGRAIDAATRIGAGGTVGGVSAGMIDPESYKTGAMLGAIMPHGVKVAGMAGKGARELVAQALGSSTGTGAESVKTAYRAGKAGNDAFVKHMRGEAPFDDVITQAKLGLERMRIDRANAYRSGMANITSDKTVLDMAPILNDVKGIQQMGYYKGQPIQKNASGVVDDITETVNNWANLDPAEYHTPEGMDALKRAIGDIRDSTQFGTPARKAADKAYNSVKAQINAQAPEYAKVMRDYTDASETLDEITRGLSVGEKSTKDAAIRKLQSLMRNNAQTNYGNRLDLANTLEQQGGVSLMQALAGQSMNTWTPRGMTGAITKSAFPFAAGGAAFTNPAALGLLAASAPLASPRAVGEALYGLGSISRGAQTALNPAKSFLGQAGLLGPVAPDYSALIRSMPIAISASP